MHISTSMAISDVLKSVLSVLERENTPEEYGKVVEELRSLVKETSVDYAEKPISKKAWDNLWSGVIGDFIITFEHNALTKDEVSEWDETDFFLGGMVKGMWVVYKMIEELMVREK